MYCTELDIRHLIFYLSADRVPFTVLFASDNWEWDGLGTTTECDGTDVGFRLSYEVRKS